MGRQTWRHQGHLQFDKCVENGKSDFKLTLALNISPLPDFAVPQRALYQWSNKAPLYDEIKCCVIGRKEPESHRGSLTSLSDSSCQTPHVTNRDGAWLHGPSSWGRNSRGMSGKERDSAKASISHARQTSKWAASYSPFIRIPDEPRPVHGTSANSGATKCQAQCQALGIQRWMCTSQAFQCDVLKTIHCFPEPESHASW